MQYDVVGYGSLLSHKSLKETIKDKKFIPVIVKGYKRIFDLDENSGDELNVEKSKNHKFNGVLFKVNEKELEKIKGREDGYNIDEVDAYEFTTKKKIGKCFLFIDYYDVDYEKKTPDKSYFILCREAAYAISDDFGKFWDLTTYTSDGESVYQWIEKHKGWDTISRKL